MIQMIQSMVTTAVAETQAKEAAAATVRRRAVPVRQLRHGISNEAIIKLDTRGNVLTIPEYDPDYPTALDMLEEQRMGRSIPDDNSSSPERLNRPQTKMEGPSGLTDGNTIPGKKETIAPRAKKQPLWEQQYTSSANAFASRDSSQMGPRAVSSDDTESENMSPVSNSYGGTPTVKQTTRTHRILDEDPIPIYEQLEDEYDARALLRLGVDRAHLSTMAEDIHSRFLTDLIANCRKASSTATSIEELAMHALLLDKVKQVFGGDNIKKLRKEMIASAVQQSLRSSF
jgi:hypothetical protein